MIIDRILQIIEYKGLNKSQFYKKTGLSNGFLDKVKDIGSSKIEKILNAFPDINPEWLLTGTGEMLKNEHFEKNDSSYLKELIALQREKIENLEKENAELRQIKRNLAANNK